MTTSSRGSAINTAIPISESHPPVPPAQQAPTATSNPILPRPPHPVSVSVSQTATPISSSLLPTSSSAAATPRPGKPKHRVKAPNVFTNDGSFLDRLRRSMKEEDDRRKEKEIQASKLHFADRFKSRGKRHKSPEATTPGGHSASDVTPESEVDPSPKRRRLSTFDRSNRSTGAGGPMTAQEEYHNAMGSYPTSLKDGGTGVRPLIK